MGEEGRIEEKEEEGAEAALQRNLPALSHAASLTFPSTASVPLIVLCPIVPFCSSLYDCTRLLMLPGKGITALAEWLSAHL